MIDEMIRLELSNYDVAKEAFSLPFPLLPFFICLHNYLTVCGRLVVCQLWNLGGRGGGAAVRFLPEFCRFYFPCCLI